MDSDSESTVAESASTSSASCIAIGLPPRKKIKRDSKWQDDWKRYNMKQSEKGVSFVFCKICSIDFSVPLGGGGGGGSMKLSGIWVLRSIVRQRNMH